MIVYIVFVFFFFQAKTGIEICFCLVGLENWNREKDKSKFEGEKENFIISKEEINEAKSDFLPSITISGYVSDENTTKLTNRSGADVQSTDVDPSQESILIEQTLFQGLGGMANLEKKYYRFRIVKIEIKESRTRNFTRSYRSLYKSYCK